MQRFEPLLTLETESETRLETEEPETQCMEKIVLMMLVFQTVVLAVILIILVVFVPEISKILRDVTGVLPEMQTTVEKLTWMVPEVDRGIRNLDKMCTAMNLHCV